MQRREVGWIERLRLTAKVARQFYTQGTLPWQHKSAPFLWPTWRRGEPQYHLVDLYSYINEGFNANAVIYSAILYKGRAMTAAPLRAFRGDRDQPEPLEEGHLLSKLVARPNPHQSLEEFQMLNVAYLDLSGNCYIYLDRPKPDALPEAMYTLRPDRVWIVPDKGNQLAGFVYVPEGKSARDAKPILPQNMMHVKWPNPWDPLEGLGEGVAPLSPMAKSADVDNMVTDFLHNFFQRGTMPMTAITFPDPVDEPDMAKVRDYWMDIYGGVQNWVEPAVMDQGAKVERLTPTFDEMGFDSIDERNETRILGPLGVPPILLGMRSGLKHATYSNYEEARRACWEDTIIPENRLFEVEYQYYLQGEGGEFVLYDYSKVPALQRDVPALATAYASLVQYGVPPNLAAHLVGLPVEEIPGGDVSYMPMAMMPSGASKPQLPEGQGASATDEERLEEGKALTKERKDLLAKQIDRVAESWEGKFGEQAVELFQRELRKLLALLTEAKAKAVETKATVNWEQVYSDWLEYLALSGEEWRKAFLPLIRGVIVDQGKHLALAYGATFDVEQVWAEAALSEYALTFAEDIMQTTKDDIAVLIREALHEGWTIPQMTKSLEQMFSKYMADEALPDEFREWFGKRMPRYRREAIARTETMKASNYGTHELMKSWGVPMKQWWSAMDERVRDSHKPGIGCHGQVRAIDQPFDVGGYQMMRPHDGSLGAGPEEIINCRCVELPYKPEWEGQ